MNKSRCFEGFGAFSRCSALESVIFEEGSKCATIDEFAFNACSALDKIKIPLSVSVINKNAFAECYNLTIYCEAEKKLIDWNYYWNPDNCTVYWGQ